MFDFFKRKVVKDGVGRDKSNDYKHETIVCGFPYKSVTIQLSAYGLYGSLFISALRGDASKVIASLYDGSSDYGKPVSGRVATEVRGLIYDAHRAFRQSLISKEDFKVKAEAILRTLIPEEVFDKCADMVEEGCKNKAEEKKLRDEEIKMWEKKIGKRIECARGCVKKHGEE